MGVRSRLVPTGAALAFGALLIAGAVGAGAGGAGAAKPGGGGRVLYVANTSGHGLRAGCATARYTTITAAVTAASAGDTIAVCPGVYHEDVVVPAGKPLTIKGMGNAIVDAFDATTHTSLDNGVQVLASGTTVEGLTVAYAQGEGILVGSLPGKGGTVSHVTIEHNTVMDNDRGNPTGAPLTTSSYAECNASGPIPGDCGEGVHLLSADHSKVMSNVVTGNAGGVLVTDENGPAEGNLIASNDVTGNVYDCGITLAGHHAGTTTNGKTWTTVAPSVGGVFDNIVRDNTATNNGVLGQGGNVLLATGAPGGAVYDNLVKRNILSGGGLAGVTIHAHTTGEDLNGNVIRANAIGTNNLDGDFDFGGNTPPAIDSSTTGVLIGNATGNAPIKVTVTNNRISNDTYGIWMTPGVKGAFAPNRYSGVTTDTFTA